MYRDNPSINQEVPIVDLNLRSLPESIKLPTPPIRITSPEDGYQWDPNARPFKEWTRHIVAQEIADKPKKKNLLVFPSSTGRDIDVLKYYNVVDPNATWIWVERDEAIADYFQNAAKATDLFGNDRVLSHKDSLHTLQLRGLNIPVDFAWFDLVGNITWPDLTYFLNYFRFDEDNLSNVDLYFTFAARGAWRGGTTFGSSTPLFKLMANTLLDFDELSQKFGITAEIKDEYKKLRNLTPEASDEDCDFGGERRSIITRSCALDDVVVTHLLLFKYIFSSYRHMDFDCNAFIYQDPGHHEMVLYHLSNFRKNPEAIEFYGRDPIDVIIKLYENKNKDNGLLATYINEYIGKETSLEPALTSEDIGRWRALNRLSSAGLAEEFDFGAELEENLLNTIEDWPTDFKISPDVANLSSEEQIKILLPNLRNLLREKLSDFISLKNRVGQDIIIEATDQGLRISTPICEKFGETHYRIEFGTQTLLRNSQHIQIIPRFLHEDNLTGLHALFRIIFMGDPYLHPQLCYHIDPSCFSLTAPQEIALNKWVDSWNHGEHAGVIVLPTGMGKTTVAVEISRMILTESVFYGEKVRRSKFKEPRILFLADQAEILDQAIKSFLKPIGFKRFITEEDIGVFYAECYSPEVAKIQKNKGGWNTDTGKVNNLTSKVVFASTDSLVRHLDLIKDDPNSFSLVIVDEAHHSPAPTWKRVLQELHQDVEYLLGITATPFRMDDQSVLEPYGNQILYSMLLNRGVYLGYLVWAEYSLFRDTTAYSKKYSKALQVEEDDYQDEIIQRFIDHAANLKTVGFCKSKAASDSWANAFTQKLGIQAASLHEDTTPKRRKEILADFKAGKIQVLFVKDLFNEGVDVPDIEAILFLRKTESAVKHLQQLGRGLRLAVGKRKLVVLDFTSNYTKVQQLIEMMSILGFDFQRTAGGGGEGPEPPEDLDAPRVKFNLSEEVELYVRNSYKKEAEKILENYIRMKRLQGSRLKDIHVDDQTRGTTAAKLDRIVQKIDHEITKDTPMEVQKMKDYSILYETLEYLFAYTAKDDAYEAVKPAKVTREQFEMVWSCIEQKIPKSECVRQILSKIKRRIRRHA